jgi:hypothetical protein
MENLEEIWNQCLDFDIEQKPEEFSDFFNFLFTQKKRKCALEIGSNFGGMAYGLCNIYEKVVTIDIKYHENFDRIKEKFPNYDYIIMDSNSNDLLSLIESMNIEFDLVFIDGDHSYDGVKSDYLRFKRFLSNEGLMGFHDIVKSEINRSMGNEVDILWEELSNGDKIEFIATEKISSWKKKSLFHRLNENTPYQDYGGIGLIKKNPINVFVHNYLENHWIEVVTNQLNKLISSGLYEESQSVYFGVYSSCTSNLKLFRDIVEKYDSLKKIKIRVYEKNKFEFDTLISLQNFCSANPIGSVLYFHTKGTSRSKDKNVDSWRECMEYFNIEKWNSCHSKIENEGFDVCGAMYVTWFKFLDYHFKNYFSGNFWWAKASYVKKLPNLTKLISNDPINRTLAEMWLGMNEHAWYSTYNINLSSWYGHYFDPKDYRMD